MTFEKFLRRQHNRGFAIYALGAVFYTLWFIVSWPLYAYFIWGDNRTSEIRGGILGGYRFIIYSRIELNSTQFVWYVVAVHLSFILAAIFIRVMDKGQEKMEQVEQVERYIKDRDERRKKWLN